MIVLGIITLIVGVLLSSIPWIDYFILKVSKLFLFFYLDINLNVSLKYIDHRKIVQKIRKLCKLKKLTKKKREKTRKLNDRH